MHARPTPLLVVSALVYFAAALPLLFAPQELLTLAGGGSSALSAALLQVIGSAVFGFAMLNWMNRHAVIGGIFGRPLVVANLAHACSAALLLAPATARASFPVLPTLAAASYAVMAIAFGVRFYVQPGVSTDS